MANWLEHSVQVEVPVPIEGVWELWSDIEKMPQWMKWIDSVKISEQDPELSVWKFASGQFSFDWRSRITRTVDCQLIQWESVDGLPNRGAIRFYDRNDHSVVRLTIAYAIPGIIGILVDNLFLGNLVESTLQADLERFRDYAKQHNSASQHNS
ncbi:MAG: SRPBCC family protein [Cyanobacteria bacterium P01_D01_bin.73]